MLPERPNAATHMGAVIIATVAIQAMSEREEPSLPPPHSGLSSGGGHGLKPIRRRSPFARAARSAARRRTIARAVTLRPCRSATSTRPASAPGIPSVRARSSARRAGAASPSSHRSGVIANVARRASRSSPHPSGIETKLRQAWQIPTSSRSSSSRLASSAASLNEIELAIATQRSTARVTGVKRLRAEIVTPNPPRSSMRSSKKKGGPEPPFTVAHPCPSLRPRRASHADPMVAPFAVSALPQEGDFSPQREAGRRPAHLRASREREPYDVVRPSRIGPAVPNRPRRIGARLGCLLTIGQEGLLDLSPVYG
jgi:hypothetical protein